MLPHIPFLPGRSDLVTMFAYPGQVRAPGMLWVLCQETLAISRIAQNPIILAGRLGWHGLAIWVPWADDLALGTASWWDGGKGVELRSPRLVPRNALGSCLRSAMLLWVGRRVGACGLILRAPELFTTRPACPAPQPGCRVALSRGGCF